MAKIKVEVAYATPKEQTLITLQVDAGCPVEKAIVLSGLLDLHPELKTEPYSVGIWSKTCSLNTLVKAHDRIEIYRPLMQSAMEARRKRVKEKKVK